MKWLLWISLSLLLGYVALRATLAAVISSKTEWVGGSGWWSTVTTYGVADMVEVLKADTEPSSDA